MVKETRQAIKAEFEKLLTALKGELDDKVVTKFKKVADMLFETKIEPR